MQQCIAENICGEPISHGDYWSAAAGRSINKRYGVLFKAVFYDADQHATDTTKFWIMFTANY